MAALDPGHPLTRAWGGVARMKRSEIRRLGCRENGPGFRFAHPGYARGRRLNQQTSGGIKTGHLIGCPVQIWENDRPRLETVVQTNAHDV